MGIEFVPEMDSTVTMVHRTLGDPFADPLEIAIIPLSEPVQVKAGHRYESGFENGEPYIRELAERKGG